MHPEEKAPVIELVFTRLHAGGKFDKGQGGAYSFSGGLHGVGVSVTNALSRRMEASSWRDGQVATLVFEGGDVRQALHTRAQQAGDLGAGKTGKVRFAVTLDTNPPVGAKATLTAMISDDLAANVATSTVARWIMGSTRRTL